MSTFNERYVDVARYGSKAQQQLELERLDERFSNRSYTTDQSTVINATNTIKPTPTTITINDTIQPVISKEDRMAKLNAEREEEELVRKMLFNRAISNNSVILPNGTLLSDVQNKTIITSLHTHVNDGKNIKQVVSDNTTPSVEATGSATPAATDVSVKETAKNDASKGDEGIKQALETPKKIYNVSKDDIQGVKLQPTPVKRELSESSSSSSTSTDGNAISFATNQDEKDLPLLGRSPADVAGMLPSGLLNLFKNGGRIRTSDLIFKLSNYAKNLNKRDFSNQEKEKIRSYVNGVIETLRMYYSINSFVKFNNPKELEGGKITINKIMHMVRKQRSENTHSRRGKDIPFGNLMINEHDLYNGVLNVRRPNGTRFANFSKRNISKELAKLIFDIAQGKTYQIDFAKLSHIEQDIIARLIKTSRLDQQKDFSEMRYIMPPTKLAIENELKRLIGEISAGNDSPLLKRNLSNIVSYLENYHSFNPNLARQIIKQYVLS